MLHRIVVSAGIATLLTTSLCGGEPEPVGWHADWREAARLAVESDKPLLLYLTMPGCHYCRRMKQETLGHDRITRELSSQYVSVQLSGPANPELATKLRVRVYPTTAFVHPTGRVVDVVHGFQPPNKFVRRMAVAKAKLAASVATKPTSVKQK